MKRNQFIMRSVIYIIVICGIMTASGYTKNACGATNGDPQWILKTIDASDTGIYSYAGYYNSIATDSNGKIHIAYNFRTTVYVDGEVSGYKSELRYSSNQSGLWELETVFGNALDNGGEYVSIAIDSQDKEHLSFCGSGYFDGILGSYYALGLLYSTNIDHPEWDTKVINNTKYYTVKHTSIAIDSSDKLHIVYSNSEGPYIAYANNVSGEWKDNIVGSGKYASMAVDIYNNIHIVYSRLGDGNIVYANNVSGAFESISLGVGSYNSIAIDSNNHVHIIYMDVDNLKYAALNSRFDILNSQMIDSNIIPCHVAIALDSQNSVHISYYGKYASNVCGVWNIETIDENGENSDLVVDSKENTNNIHISYYDRINKCLKYATKSAPLTCAKVTVKAADSKASELGTDRGRFVIARTGDRSKSLTVYYRVAGTAKNGTDYRKVSGKLTIPVGKASASFYVTPLNDRIKELKETVKVSLLKRDSYIVGTPASATVRIADND
jgi:hypothetical protein